VEHVGEQGPRSPKRHGAWAWGVEFPSERSGEDSEYVSERVVAHEPPGRAFTIRLEKEPGGAIGASLGNVPTGAVVFCAQEGGVLDGWNKENPDKAVQPGFIIEEVNGVSGYWPMLESLRMSRELVVKIAMVPPTSAGPTWFEDIAALAKQFEQSDSGSHFLLRLPQQDPTNSTDEKTFAGLPSVVASMAGVDQCAICLEDVSSEEVLTQLPCHHAFHPLCAARWLSQCSTQCASRKHSCPLCCRQMVNTQEGVMAVEAECPSSLP